jgi:hypothetical protein
VKIKLPPIEHSAGRSKRRYSQPFGAGLDDIIDSEMQAMGAVINNYPTREVPEESNQESFNIPQDAPPTAAMTSQCLDVPFPRTDDDDSDSVERAPFELIDEWSQMES